MALKKAFSGPKLLKMDKNREKVKIGKEIWDSQNSQKMSLNNLKLPLNSQKHLHRNK